MVKEHSYPAGQLRSRGNYSSLATRRALLTSLGSRYIRSMTFLIRDNTCFKTSAELFACCEELPSSTCGFNAHKTQSMCCEKAKFFFHLFDEKVDNKTRFKRFTEPKGLEHKADAAQALSQLAGQLRERCLGRRALLALRRKLMPLHSFTELLPIHSTMLCNIKNKLSISLQYEYSILSRSTRLLRLWWDQNRFLSHWKLLKAPYEKALSFIASCEPPPAPVLSEAKI